MRRHYEQSSDTKWMSGKMDFTGSFMMVVLKLVSIAMDYQDGYTKVRCHPLLLPFSARLRC